jgi:LacI family transcriptional regulator
VARQSTDVMAVADEEVAGAIRFIRQHACDPIQVRDVLEMAGMSRSTLEARFRETIGRSIHAEIRRVQIDTARRLLITTSMPIKEVVQRVGVSSVQYFTAMIRHATGQTPGEIRKSALR